MSIQERRAYSHNTATSYFTNIERDTGILSKSILIEEGLDGTGAAGVYTATINVPPNAVIQDIRIQSTVLWTAGTSASLIVGDSVDPDGYFTAVDLKANDLLVDEVINFNNLGGTDGAYITAAAGSFQQTFDNTAAGGYDIILEVTTVGTAALLGRTYVTVMYSVPTVGVSTYVAT